MDSCELRTSLLKNCHKIVVKAGTRLLTDRNRIGILVDGIAELRKRNYQVILVTSGAVGMGMKELGLEKRPKKLAEVQALAAIGQGKLMEIYEQECANHGIKTAQLLLTAMDLRNRSRYLNAMNCINALLDNGVLPIVNENDSVSVDELKFGDNDMLAAMLGSLTNAELTVILTTETGLRNRDENGELSDRISVVEHLDDSLMDIAQGTDNSEFSIGGMSSKLRAAHLVMASGNYLYIADGRVENILIQIADGKDVGTLFLPLERKLHSKKIWINFFSKCSGKLYIDSGAANALTEKGKSLLPLGVKAIAGSFKRGDTVEIIDQKSQRIIARGLVNYDAEDCLKIMQKHSKSLADILGKDTPDELVHRDNLVLI